MCYHGKTMQKLCIKKIKFFLVFAELQDTQCAD